MTDEKYQDEKNTDENYQEKDILEDEGFNKSLGKATAIANKKAEDTAAKAAADKNNSTSNKGTQTVKVSDFDMPFGSMVVFMVKWAIASIPAFLILMFMSFFLVDSWQYLI